MNTGNGIRQLSVFIENKPGRLAAVTEKLYEAGINIRALTIAEAGDFGIIRMVVDQTEKAYTILKNSGFTVSLIYVLTIEVKDEPGSLFEISKILARENINIEYLYAFTSGARALIVLRLDDHNRGFEVLREEGFRVVV